MEIYSRADKLPQHNQYVLAFFPDSPWHDPHSKEGKHKWVVVKFVRGISEQERDALPNTDDRKWTFRPEDEQSNNIVPYYWRPFGPGSFFGQSASLWCELPCHKQ